eukprot:6203829-Pleurochrysis_carterae.AAC.5
MPSMDQKCADTCFCCLLTTDEPLGAGIVDPLLSLVCINPIPFPPPLPPLLPSPPLAPPPPQEPPSLPVFTPEPPPPSPREPPSPLSSPSAAPAPPAPLTLLAVSIQPDGWPADTRWTLATGDREP